jgi:hypothetical protein
MFNENLIGYPLGYQKVAKWWFMKYPRALKSEYRKYPCRNPLDTLKMSLSPDGRFAISKLASTFSII